MMAPEEQNIHEAALKIAGLTRRKQSQVSEEKSRTTSASYVLADANGNTLARVPLEKCLAMQETLQQQRAKRQTAPQEAAKREADIQGLEAQESESLTSTKPPAPAAGAATDGAGSSETNGHLRLPLPDLEENDKNREFAIRIIPYTLLFAIVMGFISCTRMSREDPLPGSTRYCYNKQTNTYYKPKFGESCSTGQYRDAIVDKGITDSFRLLPSRLLPFRR